MKIPLLLFILQLIKQEYFFGGHPVDELREIARKTRATVIGLTETKLDATVLDSEVNIDGYELIRSDRNRHRGGLACCIKNNAAFRSRGGFP